ncbi:MAG: hypothetical protein GQ574_18510 [Crocinitomix sp.]|nr:hypothetical protein [Crocinitomix sp.]
MENQKKKALKKLVATLKLHQEMLGSTDGLSDYLKANNTADYDLMVATFKCIEAIERLLVELRNEADKSDAWDYLDEYD